MIMYPKTGKEIKGIDARLMEPLLDYPNVFIGAIQDKDGKAITTGGRTNLTLLKEKQIHANKKQAAFDMNPENRTANIDCEACSD